MLMPLPRRPKCRAVSRSFRIPPAVDRALDAAAREKQWTKSFLIRDILVGWLTFQKAKGKVDPFAEYPEPLIDAVNIIGDLTPSADPDGRAIRIDAAKLIERMDGLTKSNPEITPGLLAESWRDYLASKPMKI